MNIVTVERTDAPPGAPGGLETEAPTHEALLQAGEPDFRFLPGVKRGPITPTGKKP